MGRNGTEIGIQWDWGTMGRDTLIGTGAEWDRDGDTMGSGHNGTGHTDQDGNTMERNGTGIGIQWDWGTMGRDTLIRTGAQWDGMGQEWGYNGIGAQWNGTH